MASNHFVVNRDHTDAFYRRFRVIPFVNQIGEGDRRQHYGAYVWEAEAPQIINWALEGAVRFMAHGFSDSPGHDEYMRLWRLNTDSVRHFFVDSSAIELVESRPETGWIPRAEAYRRYKDWCQEYGLRPVGSSTFYESVDSGRIPGVRLVKGDGGRRFIRGAAVPAGGRSGARR